MPSYTCVCVFIYIHIYVYGLSTVSARGVVSFRPAPHSLHIILFCFAVCFFFF
jgi:hypothetical protein